MMINEGTVIVYLAAEAGLFQCLFPGLLDVIPTHLSSLMAAN